MNMESNEKPIINRIKVVLVENREGQTNGWQTLLEKTAQQFQNGVPYGTAWIGNIGKDCRMPGC